MSTNSSFFSVLFLTLALNEQEHLKKKVMIAHPSNVMKGVMEGCIMKLSDWSIIIFHPGKMVARVSSCGDFAPKWRFLRPKLALCCRHN